MNLTSWLKGLLASIVSSVATTLLAVLGSNATGSPLNYTQIANVAVFSAIIGACLYLKQSPIPTDISTVTTLTSLPPK